jgi:hypothetical protein
MISNEPKIFIVKSRKSYFTVLFALAWLCLFSLKAKSIYKDFLITDLKSQFFDILFAIISLWLIYKIMWILFGKTTFILDYDKLIVKTGISIIKVTTEYKSDQIKNLKIAQEVKTSYYWNFGGFLVNDSVPEVLTFDYNNKKVILGLNLEKFDIESLKKHIMNN